MPALWRFHAVHHSTEHLDWISGFRNHPFDGAIVAPPFFFLLAAGFDATFTGALAVVQIVLGLFLHANVRWRLRPLHRLVITPEFHHWHHANEIDAHNSNYSVFLPLWDIVFGTYYMPRNKRPLRYGVGEPIPITMAGQFRCPFQNVRSPGAGIRHPWKAFRAGIPVVTTDRVRYLAIDDPPEDPAAAAGRTVRLGDYSADVIRARVIRARVIEAVMIRAG